MAPSRSRSKSRNRHVPLEQAILNTGPLKTKSKKRKTRLEDESEGYIDSRSSGKILKLGQNLAEEEQQENAALAPNPAFTFESRGDLDDGSAGEEETQHDDEDAWGDEDAVIGEIEIDPNDTELFNRFMPSHTSSLIQSTDFSGAEDESGTNLTNLILEKIAAHEAADGQPTIDSADGPEEPQELPPKVVEVYSKIGLLLSRYKSGALPKPFKLIPNLPQWEELLALTRPESWTSNAYYSATKIFISSKPFITQVFLRNVLLERVREDIYETKKLNVHLFNALKKSLYKPAAFFKGFLFPLLTEGSCTLREATIVSSVLVRISVPVLHSAAALLRLTEIAAEQTSALSSESAGATNIFIRVLLEKNYALPYKVIDGLVFHFLRFRATAAADSMPDASTVATNEAALPVLWHKCLLAFAQRYRNDITEDQREALLDLLLTRGHKDIGPEVRRELLEGRGRGVSVPEPRDMEGDDTMLDIP
ncbi:snoRNA-binding rRNA-processing protein [Lecanora helva]